MASFEDRLSALADLYAERDRLSARRDRLRELVLARRAEAADAKRDMKGAERAMHAAGAFSWRTFKARIQGWHTAHLEAREAAYVRARMRHDALAKEIQTLERDLVAANDSVRRVLADVERASNELAQGAGTRIPDEMGGAVTAVAKMRAEIKELGEASQATEAAQRELGHLRDLLGLSSSAGIADILVGGLLVSWHKRGIMQRANRQARVVQARLSRLKAELGDIGEEQVGDVVLGNDWAFFDVWLDNILTDIAVQRRIERALRATVDLEGTLRALLARLEGRKGRALGRIERLERELIRPSRAR